MADLHKTRCFNHAAREAVARCPVCKNFFCRECITEHTGRVMCAACIQKAGVPKVGKSSTAFKTAAKAGVCAANVLFGILFLWIVFYAVGRILLLIPDSFHTGDLWRWK